MDRPPRPQGVLKTGEPPASVPAGLCATCVHARVLKSDRGMRFYRCSLSDTDPRYARYPTLPVVICAGYENSAECEMRSAE